MAAAGEDAGLHALSEVKAVEEEERDNLLETLDEFREGAA